MQERFKPRLDGDFSLHYEDPDFDGDLCLLVDIQELPEKGTLRVVRPEGAGDRDVAVKLALREIIVSGHNIQAPDGRLLCYVRPAVFAEFHRINNVNLRNQFYKELDRHTPKLITLFRDKGTKTGKIAEELAKLMRIYELQSADGPDLTDTPVALLTVVTDDTTDAALFSPESICIVVED
ncbi:unnamed protein product [Coregonus sp. 'balchen']|nr:unnamed protein product [Coregonus sp. 'balchen']